ncbi:MAG TPA: UDP-N-acetylmuramate dehydrogenase [Candidatus Paceibacterota bacterium]|nr:UDP-N-acetylmuramate dehydrogenase [Candidatus Paceibacterota bacterium]
MNLRKRVPLAPLTTLGVGGVGRFFVAAESVEDATEALHFARTHALSVFVLGGGSNIVIADGGVDGLVLAVRVPSIVAEANGNRTEVTVGAGVVWDDFVVWTIAHGFAGLECLSGVPGTVGGAVVANLGAYGAQCSDTFVRADVLDTHDLGAGLKIFGKEECIFSYHDSMFGHVLGRYIVIRATFALSTDPSVQLSYRDNRFDMTTLTAKLGHTPTREEVRDAVLTMREAKGSLIMPDRVSYKSAGSFFHMPFVSEEQYEKTAVRARELDAAKEERLRPWAWKQPDGSYKVAPGFLLEYTEFQKGYVRGAVGISPRHTLSIINVADARAVDIARLASDMQRAVENIFSIRLEREVEYIGQVERGM